MFHEKFNRKKPLNFNALNKPVISSIILGISLLFLPFAGAGETPSSPLSIELHSIPSTHMHRLEAHATFDSPLEEVWQEMQKFNQLGLKNALLDILTVQKDRQENTILAMKVGLPKPFPKVSCVLSLFQDEGEYRLSLKQKSGCLKGTSGYVSLKEENETTKITFVMEYLPSSFVPKWAYLKAAHLIIPQELKRIARLANRPSPNLTARLSSF